MLLHVCIYVGKSLVYVCIYVLPSIFMQADMHEYVGMYTCM